jgi:hypothetical protein
MPDTTSPEQLTELEQLLPKAPGEGAGRPRPRRLNGTANRLRHLAQPQDEI